MSSPTKAAMLAYLAGTFLVGGITGSAVGYRYGRQPIFRPPNPDSMLQHLKDRYTRELSLTEEQQKLLDPIVRQNMADWERSHRDQMKQMQVMIKQGRERIETILTEEQKAKFREAETNRERRFKSGPGGPGGPPSDHSHDKRPPQDPPPDGKPPLR